MTASYSPAGRGKLDMLWRFQEIGKSDAVAAKVAADFANLDRGRSAPDAPDLYLEAKEIAIKNTIAALVAESLAAQPSGAVVRVQCSCETTTENQETGQKSYALSVTVEPICGFIG
jgi:hypothetical protein